MPGGRPGWRLPLVNAVVIALVFGIGHVPALAASGVAPRTFELLNPDAAPAESDLLRGVDASRLYRGAGDGATSAVGSTHGHGADDVGPLYSESGCPRSLSCATDGNDASRIAFGAAGGQSVGPDELWLTGDLGPGAKVDRVRFASDDGDGISPSGYAFSSSDDDLTYTVQAYLPASAMVRTGLVDGLGNPIVAGSVTLPSPVAARYWRITQRGHACTGCGFYLTSFETYGQVVPDGGSEPGDLLRRAGLGQLHRGAGDGSIATIGSSHGHGADDVGPIYSQVDCQTLTCVVDGNDLTSLGFGAAGGQAIGPDGLWLTGDLTAATVSRVRFASPYSIGVSASGYVVSSSDDDVTYTVRAFMRPSAFAVTGRTSPVGPVLAQSVTLAPPVQARYWRITQLGHACAGCGFYVASFELYGPAQADVFLGRAGCEGTADYFGCDKGNDGNETTRWEPRSRGSYALGAGFYWGLFNQSPMSFAQVRLNVYRGSASSATMRVRCGTGAPPADDNLFLAYGPVPVPGPGDTGPITLTSPCVDVTWMDFVFYGVGDPVNVAELAVLSFSAYAGLASPAATELVSLTTAGGQIDPAFTVVGRGASSADGRFVVFTSEAANVVPQGGNTWSQVFVRDRLNRTTTLVSAAMDGGLGDYWSAEPSISDDGRFVVFNSLATNLVPNDTDLFFADVFVRDLVAGTTTLVSASLTGGQANSTSSRGQISGDGRYVVFSSGASNLVPDDTNGWPDIFVRDLQNGVTTRISAALDGGNANKRSIEPAMSATGRYITFYSSATNLVSPGPGAGEQLYLRDTVLGTTEAITTGTPPDPFGHTSVSADGRSVVYRGAWPGNDMNVYLHDRSAGRTTIIARYVFDQVLSRDGKRLLFQSYDPLTPTDTNNTADTYVLDLPSGGVQLVSATPGGSAGNSSSSSGAFSGDGRLVVFGSNASDLVTGDLNDGPDVFIRALGPFAVTNTAPVVSVGGGGVWFDELFRRAGSFIDPDQGQNWTGTVDYGDGSGPQALDIAGHNFVLTHQYAGPGSYGVGVTIADNAGGTGSASFIVDLRRRPLVFVPGFAGSVLAATKDATINFNDSGGRPRSETLKAGQGIWPEQLLTHPLDGEYFGLLQFVNGTPVAGDAIAPNGAIMSLPGGYPEVVPFFLGAGYVTGRDFFVHTYDWRYDAGHSTADFDALIDRALAATGADSVDIVAHSYGTQITRAFLLSGRNRGKVAHVVLAGAPNLGTPEGAMAVLAGECFPDLGVNVALGVCPLSPVTTQYLLRGWPGAVMQVPSSTYYGIFDGQDADHPVAFADEFGPIRIGSDYPFLRQTEIARGVAPNIIDNVETFRQDDRSWARAIGPKITLLAGTGKCTIGQVTRGPVLDLLPTPHLRFGWDTRTIDGDGTVVRQSASLQDASRGLDGAPGTVLYRRSKHNQLVEAADLADVLKVVWSRPVDTGSPTSPICFQFSIHSPMEVILTDAAGHRTGSSDGRVMIGESPDVRYTRFDDMKLVTIDGTGQYTATLFGTGVGDTTIRVQWITGGGVSRESVYRHVPTSPATRGTVSFDAVQGSAGVLALDRNGDGIVDLRIAPEQLTVDVSGDLTPPTIRIISPTAGAAVVGSFPFSWTAQDSGSGVARTSGSIDGRDVGPGGITELPPGDHVLVAFAEDLAGNAASASMSITALRYRWYPPLAASHPVLCVARGQRRDQADCEESGRNDGNHQNDGRSIAVAFAVNDATGAAVLDESVVVSLRDPAGHDVTTPLSLSHGVVFRGGTYRASLSLSGVHPGEYVVSVRFNSSRLLGELAKPVTLK